MYGAAPIEIDNIKTIYCDYYYFLKNVGCDPRLLHLSTCAYCVPGFGLFHDLCVFDNLHHIVGRGIFHPFEFQELVFQVS